MAAHSSRTAVDTVDSSIDDRGSVFSSGENGTTAIQLSESGGLPAAGRFLGRVIYNASYAVSFGVTVPVMMIVRVVPRDNAMVHGLVDGALAARDQVYGWHEEVEEGHLHDEEHGSENGTVDHEAASDRAKPRRTRAKRGSTRKTTRTSGKKS